jgi:hypothetical protein
MCFIPASIANLQAPLCVKWQAQKSPDQQGFLAWFNSYKVRLIANVVFMTKGMGC